MQKIDALFDALAARDMSPKVEFKPTHARVYLTRKLGIDGFDHKRGYAGGFAYFQYIDRLEARAEYIDIYTVTDGTTFHLNQAPYEALMGAWWALLPVLRAIENHTIEAPEKEPMALF